MKQDLDHTWFAADYTAARTRFLAAARRAGMHVQSAVHPSRKGPGGIDLAMDCAVAGPARADAALIIISATHGPEGYAGSAVQTGLLETGRVQALAARLKLVLIHAHNPYGFAWDTRFNEDNVDLNRNYLNDWNALPQNPGYDEIAAFAAPNDRTEAGLTDSRIGLLAFARRSGFDILQKALSGGQYRHPAGVYFGGVQPSWSNRTLMDFVTRACAGLPRVASIDVHTGLGPFGHGEIIFEHPPGGADYDRVMRWWSGEPRTTKDGSSVSAELFGALDEALVRALHPAQVTAVALEFGTVDPTSVFQATQASSWLHVYGDPEGAEAPEIRQAIRDAFYPQSAEWREKVWSRTLWVLENAVAGLLTSDP